MKPTKEQLLQMEYDEKYADKMSFGMFLTLYRDWVEDSSFTSFDLYVEHITKQEN